MHLKKGWTVIIFKIDNICLEKKYVADWLDFSCYLRLKPNLTELCNLFSMFRLLH